MRKHQHEGQTIRCFLISLYDVREAERDVPAQAESFLQSFTKHITDSERSAVWEMEMWDRSSVFSAGVCGL